MTVTIQVVSSHPVLTSSVQSVLAEARDIAVSVLPPAAARDAILGQSSPPHVFVLDACSLSVNVGQFVARLRVNSPGSKFLVLLPPGDASHAEELRLFYWGIDGFIELHDAWHTELPVAIQSIMNGQPWVHADVLLAFVKNAKTLLDTQLVPGHSLTAREAQVLQLLMRRLTNKEIAAALQISERTAKFHVSNILSKLQLEDRAGLSPDRLALKAVPS